MFGWYNDSIVIIHIFGHIIVISCALMKIPIYYACKDKRKNRSLEFLFLNSSYILLIKRRAPT